VTRETFGRAVASRFAAPSRARLPSRGGHRGVGGKRSVKHPRVGQPLTGQYTYTVYVRLYQTITVFVYTNVRVLWATSHANATNATR